MAAFAEHLLKRGEPLALLMNNAGTMETERRITEDGLERTVSVNYVGPYLLTRKLLPLMGEGSRIVNMVSCTYAIGHLDFPDFFLRGRKGGFWRIPISVSYTHLDVYKRQVPDLQAFRRFEGSYPD